ncbi:MAG: aspartate carbamoyltransferase [Candidatus Heimdallarchaeota archaeon]|nr:aspartate carbamoyltransferase [Candidatus Heimdallarchaeota archaeon]
MNLEHLFTIRRMSKNLMEDIFDLASSIEEKPDSFAEKCKGKILAALFFEPSTRTRLSFESAMLRLGGQILGFSSAKVSSSSKGESIADTFRMLNHYAHIAVIRHYIEGIGEIAKEFATIPMISGGTGTQEHPTQALLDLYTIRKELGKVDDITIGIMGDLLYGRTIPSLLFGLAKYDNVKVHLISPPALHIRKNVKLRLEENGLAFRVTENHKEVIDELDVLYVTRLQKERFPDPTDYERLKGAYQIRKSDLRKAKDSMIILHPLPRVSEIPFELDELKYAKYFDQAKNGVWVRMALILKYLGVD